MTPPTLAIIIGCTGSGKGAIGRELAGCTGGEIVSLDSMKVYRRMDIGTAKPSPEIRRQIPHHLIDVVEPSEEFSVARYVTLAERAIADIQARGKPVFVVGGTPLYLKALTEGLFEGPGADPAIRARLHAVAGEQGSEALHRQLQELDAKTASRIHPNDLRRIVRALEVYELTGKPISALQVQWDRERSTYGGHCPPYLLIGLRREREDQNHRTNMRVHRMIEAGLVEEVKSLLAESRPLSNSARQAVGYAEIIQHIEGRLSLADAIEMIKINTRQFAKAQRTWFKRFRSTEWVDLAPGAAAAGIAGELLEHRRSLWPT